MTFEKLRFQANWRSYQARVLDELSTLLSTRHLHVVAAPGSGKTILGLEVMRQIGQPALVLAPTITIRNQWIERLVSMFMPEGTPKPDWISTDIRKPKFLTVITYQALHAAFSGEEEIIEEDSFEPEEEITDKPKVKKSEATDVTEKLNALGVTTMVLDEAHHLRNEWWKALVKLKAGLKKPTIVSLTATPPYDVDRKEWEKYEDLCGPIDVEISVPELVKCGDLCPHQDFVYFSLPTQAETYKIEQIRSELSRFVDRLQNNNYFLDALYQHPWVSDTKNNVEDILSDPKFFSAMIIYMHAAGREIPNYVKNILGVDYKTDPPELSTKWLEILLNGVLYKHNEQFGNYKETINDILRDLRRIGAVERKKIVIDNSKEIQRLFAGSLGKLNSIKEITKMEASKLAEHLRMVVLTDFIRKDEMPKNTRDLRAMDKIGVVPIFETLRRANIYGIKLGILSGTLIVIPKESQELLETVAANMHLDKSHLKLSPLPHDDAFVKVTIVGEQKQRIVHLITEVFNKGGVTVLVGTQALLGEGWDAPSVNTLVLASFVGSYMLSNQMRGRAIRINPKRPEKVANVWHLAAVDRKPIIIHTIDGPEEIQPKVDPFEGILENLGSDVEMLKRRFRSFEGVAIPDALNWRTTDKDTKHQPIIENGFSRLGLSKANWADGGVRELNRETLSRARSRDRLKKIWDSALQTGNPKPELVEKVESNYVPQYFAMDGDAKLSFVMMALLLAGFIGLFISRSHVNSELLLWLIGFLCIASFQVVPKFFKTFFLLARTGSLAGAMKQVGWTVLETLQHMELIKTHPSNFQLKTTTDQYGTVYCQLKGGTSIEKKLFYEALQEALGPIENPRYMLLRKSYFGKIPRLDYHPIPTVIGNKKENAQFFATLWQRYIGPVDLVYTRTSEGRLTLLNARTKSLSTSNKKKTDRINIWE